MKQLHNRRVWYVTDYAWLNDNIPIAYKDNKAHVRQIRYGNDCNNKVAVFYRVVPDSNPIEQMKMTSLYLVNLSDKDRTFLKLAGIVLMEETRSMHSEAILEAVGKPGLSIQVVNPNEIDE